MEKVKLFCDKQQLKSKILLISSAIRFVIDNKCTTAGSLTSAGRHLLTKSIFKFTYYVLKNVVPNNQNLNFVGSII